MARKRLKNALLRDAIADAKSVRETALANAKVALEEAFTPHLQSMLASGLREGEFDDEYDDEDLEELNDPVNADGHGTDEGGRTQAEKIEKSSFTGNQDVTTEALDDTAENDSDLNSSDIAQPETQEYGTSAPKEPAQGASAATSSGDTDNEGLQQPAGTPVTEGQFDDDDEYGDEFGVEEDGDAGYPPEDELGVEEDPMEEMPGDEMSGGGEYQDDQSLDQDLDLETIIKELEADMMGGEEEEEYEQEDELGAVPENDAEGYEDDEYEDDPVLEQNDAEVSDGHGPGEGGAKDLAATTDSSFTQGTGDSQTDKLQEGDYDDEEIDLEEILREIEAEDDDEELVVAENSRMRGELKEYREAVLYLRSKLNEVTLLNAKLLYTNKLFKSFNMDVSQKMRVVENFDRATTPREAKLVYATLAEAFSGKPVSRKKRGRRSITEGIASRPTGRTSNANTNRTVASDGSTPTVLAEGKDLAARFKKLAGITS